MATYIIVGIIVIYSGWILYKTIRNKFKGKCDSCSQCSLSGSCSIQSLKSEENQLRIINSKQK